MKSLASLAALLTVALVTLGSTSQASAATPPDGLAIAKAVFGADDPEAAYAALSSPEKAAFTAVEVQARTEPLTSPPIAAAPRYAGFSGTFAMSRKWAAKAAAGNTLYTWWQATKVWITAGRVTRVQVYNFDYETSTPGWREGGISTATYNASWEGRGLVKAKMILGLAGWDIQHTTNCGQIRLNSDANHYLVTTSCNLN